MAEQCGSGTGSMGEGNARTQSQFGQQHGACGVGGSQHHCWNADQSASARGKWAGRAGEREYDLNRKSLTIGYFFVLIILGGVHMFSWCQVLHVGGQVELHVSRKMRTALASQY